MAEFYSHAGHIKLFLNAFGKARQLEIDLVQTALLVLVHGLEEILRYALVEAVLVSLFHVGHDLVSGARQTPPLGHRGRLAVPPLMLQAFLDVLIPFPGQRNRFHDLGKLGVNLPLRHENDLMLVPVTRAVVINVFSLLDFRRNRESARCTRHQSTERKLARTKFPVGSTLKRLLNTIEKFAIHKRRMISMINSSIPTEIARVKWLFEHTLYFRAGNASTAFGVS